MAKRWRIHPHEPERIAAVERAVGVSAVVAQLLICRGLSDPQRARQFLDCKLSDLRAPEQLPGCSQAAEKIHEAIRLGRRIVVYGDYDVDGLAGTVLLRQCLKLLGGDVGYYVPNRIDEGYGLHCEAIRRLASEKAELVVTVDCGIASVQQAMTARECGVGLIITDHHEPGPKLPDALAVVHPRLPGSEYPFEWLSGSGVALKLAWAVCQQASGARRVAPAMKDFLRQAVGLAALGTVADVVPLVDENRVLVRHGLDSLKRFPTPGLTALMKVAGLAEKRALDAEDVAFSLAPRLNAAGRLGQAQLAAELLLTDRPDRAEELARYIDQLNADRQSLERSIYLTAVKQAKEEFDPDRDAGLVLAQRGWHPGVLGIVAGRLAEKYHRPVVLITWDRLGVKPGVGSARSVPGFHLHAALEACREHLVSHGGHAAAAGLSIEEGKLDAFRNEFYEYAARAISAEDRQAELMIDAESPLSVLTLQAVEQIERLAPFGQGNARPLLCTQGVTVVDAPRTIGAGGRHLSLRLKQHGIVLRAFAFGGAEWVDDLASTDGPLDIAFRPVINAFRGRRSVELQLVDWQPRPVPT
jgi:single-stranded-DNA-specific exonuclease